MADEAAKLIAELQAKLAAANAQLEAVQTETKEAVQTEVDPSLGELLPRREGEGGYPENVEDATEWFEVVKNMVFVKAEPSADAQGIGILTKDMKIEVKPERVQGADGKAWVELTELEVLRFSDASSPANCRGYVLVDGSHMGLGPLLRGPLKDNTMNVASTRNKLARGGKVSPSKALAMARPEWFEVVKSMVLVKAEPSKDSKSIGSVRQGQRLKVKSVTVQGEDGYTWVELTPDQMQRIEGATVDDEGFCLIDGSHLGLGVLLQGPIAAPGSAAEEALWRANEEEAERSWAKDRNDSFEAVSWKRYEVAKQKYKLEEVSTAKSQVQSFKQEADLEEHHEESWRGRSGTVTYRATHGVLFQKGTGSKVVQKPCRRGVCVFTTGREWRGEQGALWVQSAKQDSSWYLVQGPGFGIEGPVMLSEPGTPDHMRVSITYSSTAGLDWRIFDAFIPQSTTVRSLRAQISEETQLKFKGIIVVMQKETVVPAVAPPAVASGARAAEMRNFTKVMMEPEPLEDTRTLSSYSFGPHARLWLIYNFDFADDYIAKAAEA